MTTSLYILANDLFLYAKAITPASPTSWDTFSLWYTNYFAGERYCYGGLTSTAASFQIDIDLGTSVTRSLDYMLLAGVSKISADATGTDLYIKGSSDNSTYTSIIGTNNLPGCSLVGDSTDILIKSGLNLTVGSVPTTAYRWLRIIGENPSVNIRWILSKIYAGTMFDMGKDPDSYGPVPEIESPHGFKYPTGNIGYSKLQYETYTFQITWRGITDAKTEEFFRVYVNNPLANYMFLHTTSQHAVLANKQLVHVKLLADQTSRRLIKQNYNEITAVFKELAG